MENKVSKKVKFLAFLILVIFLGGLIEVASYQVLRIFVTLSYHKNDITQDYQTYLKVRDNDLGWNILVDDYGNSRSLPNRKFIKDTTLQVDLYGDSFTHGDEINEDSLVWHNLISKELHIIVNNKGVGGYGSDQSFMKFRLNKHPNKIVVINHLSENIIRNVNQFRHLIYPSNLFDLKPIFIIEKGALKYVPIPKISLEEIENFKANPNPYIPYDYFKLGYESGIFYKSFPYSITLLKSLLFNWKIKAQFSYFSGHQPFYNLNHNSSAVLLTNKIFETFKKEAKSKDLIPIITIIPMYRDFEFYEKNGYFPYENLALMQKGNPLFIDFGKEMILDAGTFDLKYFRNLYFSEGGHLNEAGNKMLAKIFIKYYQKHISK